MSERNESSGPDWIAAQLARCDELERKARQAPLGHLAEEWERRLFLRHVNESRAALLYRQRATAAEAP